MGILEYEGNWKDQKKNGFGKLHHNLDKPGYCYEGTFKDNKLVGNGKMWLT